MANLRRLDELRRRVQKDPASIAFAQLAEECRRAGLTHEAIEVCRAGLATHPGYLSARVTLGRALLETGRLEAAEAELTLVLKSAPDNLAAVRGLAEVYRRRGALADALAQYRTAHRLAPSDPDVERMVGELAQTVESAASGEPARDRQQRIVAALESWLAALHGSRAERRA
jgi:Flp pilus assembly protein TadD